MALGSDGADGSYLNQTTVNDSTDFWFTALFRTNADDPAGEQDLWSMELASPFYYLSIRYDVSGATRDNLRLASHVGYEALSGTGGSASDWFGLGIGCAGTGSSDLIITFQANSSATPVTFLRQMPAGTWAPDYIRLFMGKVRGAQADVQNVKYGTGYRSAAQMQSEFYTTSLVTSGGTVVQTEMITGTVTDQRETWTAAGTISTVVGPLDSTGGTAPTVTVSSATVSGDEFTISGTFTQDAGAGGLVLNILDIVSSETQQTITPTISGSSWSAVFRANAAGSHTLRASISDSNGSDTDDSSALTIVSLSGSDELPYTYAVTGVTIVPSTLTLENGEVGSYRVIDQAGNPIRGVTLSSSSYATFGATDMDGFGSMTGTAVGSETVSVSVLNAAGNPIVANAALTVGASSGATVTVTPQTATVAADETIRLAASVTGSSLGVTWSVESGLGSVSSAGDYSSSSATTAVVRATSVEFPGSNDEATITVEATAPDALSIEQLSDMSQSAQIGAELSYTFRVTKGGAPVSASVTCTPSTSSATLTITNVSETDSNGRGTVRIVVGDGSPIDATVTLTFAFDDGESTASVVGYLQILSLLYGATELRGVTYARPRPRNV